MFENFSLSGGRGGGSNNLLFWLGTNLPRNLMLSSECKQISGRRVLNPQNLPHAYVLVANPQTNKIFNHYFDINHFPIKYTSELRPSEGKSLFDTS